MVRNHMPEIGVETVEVVAGDHRDAAGNVYRFSGVHLHNSRMGGIRSNHRGVQGVRQAGVDGIACFTGDFCAGIDPVDRVPDDAVRLAIRVDMWFVL